MLYLTENVTVAVQNRPVISKTALNRASSGSALRTIIISQTGRVGTKVCMKCRCEISDICRLAIYLPIWLKLNVLRKEIQQFLQIS